MTTDINTVAAGRAIARPNLMPPPGSGPACDSGESDLPQSYPDGGADSSQAAPPASKRNTAARRGTQRVRWSLPASLLEARLSELFWRDPDFDRLGDIEQRIANVLKGKPREGMTPDALSPEATQLFDDLYNFATC